MRAVLLPLDDRPVTYGFPQLIARVAGVEALVPPRSLFGSLNTSADIEGITEWIQNTIAKTNPDVLLLCLDTLTYGGLINSRRSPDSAKSVMERVAILQNWQKKPTGKLPIYVQSSIMRISDNYDATEEKPYWARYGREIFAWSSQMHRLAKGDSLVAGSLASSEARIPADIRQDYQQTRVRNFQANQKLVEFVQQGVISRLTFSLDDSGQTGLNILEKERLISMVQQANLTKKIATYAGADEVLCALLARWLIDSKSSMRTGPTALVRYSPEEGSNCLSRYEGQNIGETISSQMQACGIDVQKEDDRPNPLDFIVIVHTGGDAQGDHIQLPGHSDLRRMDTSRAIRRTLELLQQSQHPCVLCDVAYANGADPELIEELLQRPDLLAKLWAYSGWNTTGNSTGSALALAVAQWFSGTASDTNDNLKACLYVRLADDWAYQSKVRSTLNSAPSPEHLRDNMKPYLERISQALNYKPDSLTLGFPWNRTFEVEIGLPSDSNSGSLSFAK
jgi:hypothetical protein